MNDEIKKIREKFEERKTPLEFDNYKRYYLSNIIEKEKSEGQHWVFRFENNYGASVIKKYGSYGFEDDLFELAVIKFDGEGIYHLCYTTPITNDVIGYLTNFDVLRYLFKIKRLKDADSMLGDE